MSLWQFLDAAERPERSVVVVNRKAPDPLQRMLVRLFDGQTVSVSEEHLPDGTDDTVLLVEDGVVVESCTLDEIANEILLVNSDLFITGTRGLEEIEPLSILENLDETPFRFRGYPESNSEKMLLILISRYIERRAWLREEGTLRASFQHLARIDDEIGTRKVYQRLDDTDVDVHVYGAPGWEPAPDSSIVAHTGYSEDFLDSWFVVYTPSAGEEGHVALLALEDGPNEWVGFWTYREELVTEIADYIQANL
ncbi:DICT sensory domain-containing protein [Halorubrum gandharaense]